ncbi:bifunctional Ribosomal protein L4 domain superfamily/50S ribosomal protein uL4/Ribosomal protein L4-L1e [Babesia duncani]|uniref:Large ribosomal subunit protein uL4m n=1 Tax=Babesia duncani TaxID=323732 RepID=A0AAD9PL18_9APIC|nr:bifunctional Ribosomal protein L4 domain superfamily/50S ribosomal protein uL4/Ribosomal protein L4-L1e [Babesia duncani]
MFILRHFGLVCNKCNIIPSVALGKHTRAASSIPISHGDHSTDLKAIEYASISPTANVNDPPIIRRPGEIIDVSTVIRGYWSYPAVGFNSILELPVYVFERNSGDGGLKNEPFKYLRVPNEIFGLPIRPDILHRCYQFYRRAKAGYVEDMQLYKWEWPGSTKKWRKQQKSGKARIGWRKSPGKYLGVFAHPIRPQDQRTKITRRVLHLGLKIMCSVKFAQSQIQVVDSFLMASHKTKYAVQNLREILGKNCNSALLIFVGHKDSNENFRWATANIPSVKIETVEGVNVYNLLKYRQVVITEDALKKLIYYIDNYPKQADWLPKYATPDNKPAPVPEKVPGWNATWLKNKIPFKLLSQSREAWLEQIKNWKWSSERTGALKIPRTDPLAGFKLRYLGNNETEQVKARFQYLYDSVLDPENDNDTFDYILNDEKGPEDVSLNSKQLSDL